MAEVANHHFTTVGPKLVAQIKSLPSGDPLESSARIKCHPVSNSQVLSYLRNLKPRKASGPNNLPMKLVKDATEYTSYYYDNYFAIMLIFQSLLMQITINVHANFSQC